MHKYSRSVQKAIRGTRKEFANIIFYNVKRNMYCFKHSNEGLRKLNKYMGNFVRASEENIDDVIKEFQMGIGFSKIWAARCLCETMAPSISLVSDELRCLELEYDAIIENNCITCVSDEVVLSDYNFGTYTIMLPYEVNVINDIIVRPNSDKSISEVDDLISHPHVSNGHICLGEAEKLVNRAIFEGRFCDMFQIIKSVLNTYNPKSPYLVIEAWTGACCDNCGDSFVPTNDTQCDNCDNYYCEDCSGYCNGCNSHICLCKVVECSCGGDVCFDCLTECGCGVSLCHDCCNYCEYCGLYSCSDCISECEDCGFIGCNECVNICDCGFVVCNECVKTCDTCGDGCCKGCYNHCKNCGNYICNDCVNECTCGENFCHHCLQSCECGDYICSICEYICERCNKSFCEGCVKHDEKNNLELCNECSNCIEDEEKL